MRLLRLPHQFQHKSGGGGGGYFNILPTAVRRCVGPMTRSRLEDKEQINGSEEYDAVRFFNIDMKAPAVEVEGGGKWW